jgi:hypothetical protein
MAINASSAQPAFGPGAVINDFDGILVMDRTVRPFAVDASEYPVVTDLLRRPAGRSARTLAACFSAASRMCHRWLSPMLNRPA